MMDEGFPNFDIGDVESLFESSGNFSVSLFLSHFESNRIYFELALSSKMKAFIENIKINA